LSSRPRANYAVKIVGKKYTRCCGGGEVNPQPEKTLSIFRMVASAH